MNMKIFDCHLHIHQNIHNYKLPIEGANIIFNDVDQWLEYKNSIGSNQSVCLIADYNNKKEIVRRAIESKEVLGLKIHSRKQKISIAEYGELFQFIHSLQNFTGPIVYDAFYFGTDLEFQPSLEIAIEICKQFTNNSIVIAHSGGYKVLEYFLHLRGFSNVYFDLSVTPTYLKGSAIELNLLHLLKHGDRNKIMFGSDFPLLDPEVCLQDVLQLLRTANYSEEEINKVVYQNAQQFFINTK